MVSTLLQNQKLRLGMQLSCMERNSFHRNHDQSSNLADQKNPVSWYILPTFYWPQTGKGKWQRKCRKAYEREEKLCTVSILQIVFVNQVYLLADNLDEILREILE